MDTLAPLVARLSCAALMMAALPFARAFADPASVDVAGIKLGSTLDDAQSALNAVGDVKTSEIIGSFTLNDYVKDHLRFGSSTKVGHEISPEEITLLYDLQPPQSVIGIWRAQPFQKAKAPLVSYIRSALTEKYGRPLYDGDINVSMRVMLWNFGAQVGFPAQRPAPMRYGDCTRLLAVQELGSINKYPVGIEPLAQKCGTWVQVFISNFDDNHDLARLITVTAADLPRIRASSDYIADEMKKGLANKHKIDSGDAANNKPKL